MSRQARKEEAAAARDVLKMSFWLLNSTDSSCGANRKNEQYWTDVEVTYNKTTPSQRARNAKQIKDRCHKWITYNNGLKAARKKVATKGLGNDKEGEAGDHIDVDDNEQPRPMGQRQAKKLKYDKGKEVDHIDLEELDKFGKIQDEQNANRLKVLELQHKLSTEKMEQIKLAHLAAKEEKEARKYELESKMFETYNHLLSMDLSLMYDDEKLDHANTMKCLKKKLFPES
ncbi:hypothetical protein HU200_007146 [Digitaria exilis]|uniref:No apical meristem-associated C-terminal domain-containing protein n=1 Tax=Digitaria exilis TaxID=1010633 RepID=A0A835FNF4_9POAL|nr:hypothetical protein HU200_007146 [Digitaria exilis]